MKKKAKALKKASTKNKVIKPVKAFTGLEVALIASAAGLAGSQLLGGDKPKATAFKDPFKQYDPAMTPAEYVAKQTSASNVASESLDPVTSAGESAAKTASTGAGTTDNEQEMPADLVKVKKGGMIRGQGIALRGTRFKGIF
jgi:hypothetical protein